MIRSKAKLIICLFNFITLAAFIGLPVTYFIIKSWLNDYAYHIQLHAGYFITAFVSMLLITWVTVSYQSFKAALKNPVSSLRSE